ncbi:hypothetical protein [uncultured Bilophila sp.]|uniref:hypothetical protein n=1 Tax=uncultured Bilophila sp. TaxID=529385 RepID=UPI0025E6A559|nr:hypothetical protein [uncultured Bilophila sp.]
MKYNEMMIKSCVLLAGLAFLPLSAAHASPTGQFVADSSFTESVKHGYQDLKRDMKETVDELAGDDANDRKSFEERRMDDLKTYHKEVREARQDYINKREQAQKDYLKHHRQLPVTENIKADLDAPAVSK